MNYIEQNVVSAGVLLCALLRPLVSILSSDDTHISLLFHTIPTLILRLRGIVVLCSLIEGGHGPLKGIFTFQAYAA